MDRAGTIRPPRPTTGDPPCGRCLWEVLALGTALALVCVGVKAALLPWQGWAPQRALRWAARLAVVSWDDLGFCLVAVLIAWGMLWATAVLRPGLVKIALYAVRTGFFLCAMYAVVSWALFQVTLQVFNVRVLSLLGRWELLWSSVLPYLSVGRVVLAVAVPLGMVVVAQGVGARLARRFSPAGAFALLAAGAMAWAALDPLAAQHVRKRWPSPRIWEHRLARSPHWVLLCSCWDRWWGRDPFGGLKNTTHGSRPQALGLVPKRPLPAMEKLLPGYRPPRHVVLVWLESVGAEYVAWAGGRYRTMPHLARRLRRHGLVFRNFYVAAPYSCKSLWTLCSGTYPRPDWHLLIAQEQLPPVPLLPEILAARGFEVCFAHSGFWSWRGRDRFLRAHGVKHLIDASTLPGPLLNSWGTTDRTMFDAVARWMAARADRRTFVLAYTIQTHHPYASPRQPIDFPVNDHELRQYLGAIRATDEQLERFLRRLEHLGLLEHTLVVVTADHGESFGQHQQREHHFALYEPNVRVPLGLLYRPLGRFSPRVVHAVRSQVDLAPTLLHLLGISVPRTWQGTSLLLRPWEDRPAYFLAVSNYAVLGMRWGRWKYHYWVEQGQEELYDLSLDPGELHDLSARRPGRCRELRRRVGGWIRYQQALLREGLVR